MIIVVQTLVFFRESLFAVLDRIFRPYFKHLSLTFNKTSNVSDDEESEDHVFAEFDDEKGVVFSPPVYAQRYAAVSDCLMDERWSGKLEKIVDLGYHDMSFIKYLKDVPGVKHILGVDIESIPVQCSSDLLGCDEYVLKRETPLYVSLFQGNAADPDYRLIGCDAVIAIEMIEHMYPHDLERLVHTIFGFIKPWIAVITTPNGDFNPLFKAMEKNGLRRLDHFFEWSREQFHDWCSNIVVRYPHYSVSCRGVGPGPSGTSHYGCCSQLALFVSKDYHKQKDLNPDSLALVTRAPSSNTCDEIQALDIPDSECNMLFAPNNLNCSTLQVKKFSKKTQHLMAKNNMHSLEHTKEVVDEIRHLRKMLNFNNCPKEQVEGDHVWRNINWGENAPYWNKYYNLVREYTYPFGTKSEECRILDLILDEINRFVEMQHELDVDANKVEIPLDYVMKVVQHITDDVDRIKDLLEWNGYEIAGDMVIYSRLVVDTVSVNTRDDEWRDDTVSDWDIDGRSTSISDGSIVLPEIHGRSLYRALDHKVRKLKSMVSNNEDISTELDRVVCRLMKLALRTARRRQESLPNHWMHCKLLDLLNLTEKAIERKKQFLAESIPLKAICYDDVLINPVDLSKIRQPDESANKIVDKYRHLVESLEKNGTSEGSDDRYHDVMEDNDFNNEFLNENVSMELDFEETTRSPSLVDIEINSVNPLTRYFNSNETSLSRTKAWVDKDMDVVVIPQHSKHYISSGDTDNSKCKIARHKNKKRKRSAKPFFRHGESTENNALAGKHFKNKKNDEGKGKSNAEKLYKKCVKKKSTYNVLTKTSRQKLSASKNFSFRAKKSYRRMHDSLSTPISQTLMEFCYSNSAKGEVEPTQQELILDSIENNIDPCVAATKNSLLIDIITEDKEETIVLRRTIGTDADDDLLIFENELDDTRGSMTNVMHIDSACNKVHHESENVNSQTLFLYDINEPSTSKGVRHVSMDVQCGPESTNKLAMLSTTTSFTKVPQVFNTGVKIGSSFSDLQDNATNCDFGTCTNENLDGFKIVNPREKFTGIKIKDSDTNITYTLESETLNRETNTNIGIPSVPNSSLVSTTETTMLKPISSRVKVEDSGSEFCDSLCSSQRSPLHFMTSANDTSGFQYKLAEDVELEREFTRKYTRPKLSNGGVYVHSYKDRQVSEDVVYQGKWQKYTTSKTNQPKKKSYNVVTKKNPTNKRIISNLKEHGSATTVVLPNRNNGSIDTRQVKKISTLNNVKKVKSSSKNVTKVTSKLIKRVTSKDSLHVIKNPSKTTAILKKEKEVNPRPRKKSYIPLYLKRKRSKHNYHILPLDNTDESDKAETYGNKCEDPEKVKNILLKFNQEPRENINYLIFQNVINNNISCSTDCESPFNTNKDKDQQADDSTKRSLSPQSLNSSACSSPNSIATVRVKPTSKLLLTDRTQSSSSNRSQELNDIDNVPMKTKKVIRKCKSSKKYHKNKDSDNKENLPETSKKKTVCNNVKFSKNNSIFRAQLAPENPQSTSININKRKSTNKSNIKIPSIPSCTEKQSTSRATPRLSLTNQYSGTIKSQKSMTSENYSLKDSINPETPMEPFFDESKNKVMHNLVAKDFLAEWLNSTQRDPNESNSTDVLADMRQLVEERLEFIERLSDNCAELDSRTFKLSETFNSISASESTSFHDAKSLGSSYATVMGFIDSEYTNLMSWNGIGLDNIFFDSLVPNEFNPAVGNDSTLGITDTKPDVTDVDMLSFKSTTTASKLSEYFLAESSLNNVPDVHNSVIPLHGSVRDIFERKTPLTMESPAGPLAMQIFSGLSMNAAPLTGDQPDHVNLVDSETGSVARGYTRLANSEEVFVSGRSSDTYDSCLIDEDTVVPNWLFHIISQQQSVQEEDEDGDDADTDTYEDEDEEESEHLVQMQLPHAEPVYDMNGNAVEPGMGAGAGAGDGRGIHSDRSQDSSGRGTSLSSSVTSSEPRSEAILIDPTLFTTHIDLIREPAGTSSIIVPVLPARTEVADTSRAITTEGPMNSRNAAILNSAGDPQIVPVRAASDVDADVSSVDTDIPDSSDN
ncbi:unnamed protein product [Chilo suppressalis]|uniref:Small RNA 2'-O-methyltransferase n=1 Tax=Chilo suppressalis TaxID=168631 RepID=A0ABN8B9L9_CHISP|nr:unnamed protein product [Chilo suppressalis]